MNKINKSWKTFYAKLFLPRTMCFLPRTMCCQTKEFIIREKRHSFNGKQYFHSVSLQKAFRTSLSRNGNQFCGASMRSKSDGTRKLDEKRKIEDAKNGQNRDGKLAGHDSRSGTPAETSTGPNRSSGETSTGPNKSSGESNTGLNKSSKTHNQFSDNAPGQSLSDSIGELSNRTRKAKSVFASAHDEFQALLKDNNVTDQTGVRKSMERQRPADLDGKESEELVIENGMESSTKIEQREDNDSNRKKLQIGMQFETEVQFSYEDLISFGKLSRDWNPVHYYPDDGRVEHLSKIFRIRSLEEIEGKEPTDQVDTSSAKSNLVKPNLSEGQSNSSNLGNQSDARNSDTEHNPHHAGVQSNLVGGTQNTKDPNHHPTSSAQNQTMQNPTNPETNPKVPDQNPNVSESKPLVTEEKPTVSEVDSSDSERSRPQFDPIIPGALLNNIISGIMGTKLPGPGTLILSQTLDYKNRVFINEKVRVRVRLVNVRKMLVNAKYKAWVVRDGERVVVLVGDARLLWRKWS